MSLKSREEYLKTLLYLKRMPSPFRKPTIDSRFTAPDLKEIARLWGLKFRDGGGISGRLEGEWVNLILENLDVICKEGGGSGKEGKEEVEEEGGEMGGERKEKEKEKEKDKEEKGDKEEEEEVDVGMVGVEPKLKFVDDEWDEEILCSICYLPLVEPTQHNQCAIAFCKKCIEKANYNCPVCQDGAKKEGFSEVRTKFVLNILGRVRVFCDLCREEMGVGEFKQHQQNCGGVVVECVGKGVGCKVVRKRKRMGVHEGGCPYAIAAPIVEGHKRKANTTWLEKEKEKDEQIGALLQINQQLTEEINLLQNTIRMHESLQMGRPRTSSSSSSSSRSSSSSTSINSNSSRSHSSGSGSRVSVHCSCGRCGISSSSGNGSVSGSVSSSNNSRSSSRFFPGRRSVNPIPATNTEERRKRKSDLVKIVTKRPRTLPTGDESHNRPSSGGATEGGGRKRNSDPMVHDLWALLNETRK